tara:strand:- start:53052 stop:54620 length:1569 start_codon:yes stop_codon:yes gene_type:complete
MPIRKVVVHFLQNVSYSSLKKWTLGVLLVLLTASIVSCIGIKSQIKQHTGGNTEIVDSSKFKISPSPLAIKNVSVLSADCSKMEDSLTVLVKNGKIVNVAKDVSITSEYKIIDASGKYLIPGLIDTHTHLQRSKNDLLLYLANGVTQILNNNSDQDNILLQWRKEAEEGSLSPRIYIAAGGMSSKKGFLQTLKTWFGDSKKYNTVKQGKKAVKKFKTQGYDAIKIYNLDKEVYYAVVKEAKKQNIPTMGHLPPSADLSDLFITGQEQLAHVEEITKATMRQLNGLHSGNAREYLDYLNENADSIAIKLKVNSVTVSTTLFIIESIPKQNFELRNFLRSIELEYQNPGQIEGSFLAKGWLPGNNHYENLEAKNDPELMKNLKVFWTTYVEAMNIMTRSLVKNGVPLVVGTDSNGTGVVAGFSLHDELESLNEIGMSTKQVLKAATASPGEWMHSNSGKIEIGYTADLVLLDKNPLKDIRNSRAINAVITNGKLLDRLTLDKILQSIKNANNNSREINIDEFID